MFTEAQIRAAVGKIRETGQDEFTQVPVNLDGASVMLCRTPRYVNGTGAGDVGRLETLCPDSETVEWPRGHVGTAAASVTYALRTIDGD